MTVHVSLWYFPRSAESTITISSSRGVGRLIGRARFWKITRTTELITHRNDTRSTVCIPIELSTRNRVKKITTLQMYKKQLSDYTALILDMFYYYYYYFHHVLCLSVLRNR